MIAQHPFHHHHSPPTAAASIFSATAQHPLTSSGYIVLRQATLKDLDSMVAIALQAMPMDPQWDYRFPHRRSFPEDTWVFTRRRYREFLENRSSQWSVVLAELVYPDRKAHAQTISFAVWNIAHMTKRAHVIAMSRRSKGSNANDEPVSDTHSRRDADSKRAQAWSQTMSSSSRKLFDDQFGCNYFQLQILATHPQFQGLGAGTALCREGIDAAERLGMKIAVFASPMGKRLYNHLGFRRVGTVTVKVEDEDESISVEALVYPTSGWVIQS